MRVRLCQRASLVLVAAALWTTRASYAQERSLPSLPPTRADMLLEEGRWAEAEAAFYAQSEHAPRDPLARAALGRFIAMKGAIRPGIVLIDEARQFGLDPAVARELIAPLRAILEWRNAAAGYRRDSALTVRAASRANALFQIPLPRTGADGRPSTERGDVREVVWHDVVDRQIGLDSLGARGRPIGIEVFEALAPSLDRRNSELTLHANPRSALSAMGRRYQVLRMPRGVRVLMGERRTLPLVEALRELEPRWWQLDLVHGLLVVR